MFVLFGCVFIKNAFIRIVGSANIGIQIQNIAG